MSNSSYRLERSGRAIVLTDEVGGGGQGSVRRVAGEDLVAKIYHVNKLKPDGVAKLRYMIAHPPTDPGIKHGYHSIAWPQDIVTDGSRPIGYVMPRVPGRTLLSILSPINRKGWNNPNFSWLSLILAAANGANAFECLHAAGYVAGDINWENMLVDVESRAAIIDNDSFQVRDRTTGKIYRSEWRRAEYQAPEIQGTDPKFATLTEEHDRFGLAILMFQMVFVGAHPFQGSWRGAGDPPDDAQLIRENQYIFASHSHSKPRPGYPTIEWMPKDVQELFRRSFLDGHGNPRSRPTAREWRLALYELVKGDDIVRCPRYQRQHTYPRTRRTCPWCELLGQGANHFDVSLTIPPGPPAPPQTPLSQVPKPKLPTIPSIPLGPKPPKSGRRVAGRIMASILVPTAVGIGVFALRESHDSPATPWSWDPPPPPIESTVPERWSGQFDRKPLELVIDSQTPSGGRNLDLEGTITVLLENGPQVLRFTGQYLAAAGTVHLESEMGWVFDGQTASSGTQLTGQAKRKGLTREWSAQIESLGGAE